MVDNMSAVFLGLPFTLLFYIHNYENIVCSRYSADDVICLLCITVSAYCSSFNSEEIHAFIFLFFYY
jgi:hypothetical protein